MSKKILLLFILSFVVGAFPSKAQLSKQVKGYSESYYKTLRYGIFTPTNYDSKKRYPLIVYLHGSRDTVSRNLSWYRDDFQRNNPSFVITPKCEVADQGWGNTWQPGHSPASLLTLKLIDSLMDAYSIDRGRLYIYGISMGGFGVFSILAKEKGKFAAGYAVCGGSDTKAAKDLLNTPLWIFHGEADDVVPVRLSRNIYEEIIKLGGTKVRYTEYEGVKHNSWENVSREESLPTWLLSQQNNVKN
jgi:predicted peptidase